MIKCIINCCHFFFLTYFLKRGLINIYIYYENKIKKAIINANNAIASVKANPIKAVLNNSCLIDGFLEIAITNEPKTVPIPAPEPTNPIVAKPPPINFAA